jgi:hypothetical protein
MQKSFAQLIISADKAHQEHQDHQRSKMIDLRKGRVFTEEEEKKLATPPPFPYKSSFNKKPVKWFLDNLQKENWIQAVQGRRKYPDKLISDIRAYDQINFVTDLFTEEARMKAFLHGKTSPLQYWEKNYKEMIRQCGFDNYKLREVIYSKHLEATNFSVALSKKLYDLFLPQEGGTVLDPFSGWGDRALGVIGSERVLSYHGIDSNPFLKEGYEEIAKLDDRIQFSNPMKFEDFQKPVKEPYDLVLSSPPYFDFETYVPDHPDQSIYEKPTYDDWYYDFLEPALEKMCRSGKIIALHLGGSYRTPELANHVHETMLNQQCTQYIQKIDCCTGNKRPIPIYIYRVTHLQ